MAETTFNTRIILKHDTLENWLATGSCVLKKGEIGIATVDTATTDANGNIIHVPTSLLKVGDGTSAFSALKWVSAPAADVYEWAKKPQADFETYVKGVIANVGYLTSADLSAYAKTADVNSAIATALQSAKDYADANDADTTYTIATGTSNGTVKVTPSSGAAYDVAVKGLGTAAYTATTAYATAAQGAKADTAVQPADLDVYAKTADIPTKVSDLANDAGYLTSHQSLANYYTKAQADAEFMTQAEVDARVNEVIAEASDTESITNLTSLVDYLDAHGVEAAAMTEAITALETKVDTSGTVSAAIATALQSAKDYADANDADHTYTFASGATNGTIAVNGTDVAVKGLGSAAYTATSAYATAAQGAKADSVATTIAGYGDIVTHDVDEFEAAGAANTALTSAKSYTDSKITAEVTRANSAYDTKGAADGALTSAKSYTDTAIAGLDVAAITGSQSKTITSISETDGKIAATYSDIKITAAAVSGLATVATSGNVKDLTQTSGDVLIFDCGTSTSVI